MRRSRRAALQLLLGAAAGLAALPVRAWLGPRVAPRPAPTGAALATGLADFFDDREGAGAVGRAYLRRRPAERDPARLVRAILGGDPRLGRQLAGARRAERRALLRQQVRRDFAAGRVVAVDGWILAETEGRLCALAALLG